MERISDYPNRIRLFLGLPSPTFRGQICIRHYSISVSEFSKRANFKKISGYSKKIVDFFGIRIRLFEISNYPNQSESNTDSLDSAYWYPLHHYDLCTKSRCKLPPLLLTSFDRTWCISNNYFADSSKNLKILADCYSKACLLLIVNHHQLSSWLVAVICQFLSANIPFKTLISRGKENFFLISGKIYHGVIELPMSLFVCN